jgi:CRP-like cAMP-binding protein
MAVSFTSFISQVPSQEYIQATDHCLVSLVPFSLFNQMRTQYPQMAQGDLLIIQHYCCWLEKRVYNLQVHTAKERYLNLLATQPELVQKIPLSYVASYLGITLETLSRIRAAII